MSNEITVITNNVPRDVLYLHELTVDELMKFDYLDWAGINDGTASASFFRYKGTTYDLGEFGITSGLPAFNPLTQWDGYISDTFFSGVLVRYVEDNERVIVGRFYS